MDGGTTGETRNVLVSTALIAAIIIVASVLLLIFLTGDAYLSIYYALEIFFLASNSVAASTLSQIALSGGLVKFVAIMSIQIVDNLSRLLVISFIVAAVVDMVSYTNVENVINRFFTRRMGNHIIICGYTDLASVLIQRLREKRTKVVVIDKDISTTFSLSDKGIRTITGDFTDEMVLSNAAIGKARAIVFTTSDDMANFVGTITARHLSKKVKVLSRVEKEEVRKKFYRVGADMCTMPEQLAGLQIGEALAKQFKARVAAS